MQGVATAERATQRALAYAQDRRQGRSATTPPGAMAPIAEHPDIRRMLMQMRALTAASRALCLATAHALDDSERATDPALRSSGGQPRRAADSGRQSLFDRRSRRGRIAGRAGARRLRFHRGDGRGPALPRRPHPADLRRHQWRAGHRSGDAQAAAGWRPGLSRAIWRHSMPEQPRSRPPICPDLQYWRPTCWKRTRLLREATEWLGRELTRNPDGALAGATPYLRLFGIAAGGVALGSTALASARSGSTAPHDKRCLAAARFFATTLSPTARGLAKIVMDGAAHLPAAGAEWDGLA